MKTALFSIALMTAVLSGCVHQDKWNTDYSGKYDDANRISLSLDEQGGVSFGPCGFNHTSIGLYEVDLQPIKHEYRDTEIHLIQIKEDTTDSPIEQIKSVGPRLQSTVFAKVPAKGMISFNEDYSKVTLNIQVADDQKRFHVFKGNGEHKFKQ